jgi:hypothetical protein
MPIPNVRQKSRPWPPGEERNSTQGPENRDGHRRPGLAEHSAAVLGAVCFL